MGSEHSTAGAGRAERERERARPAGTPVSPQNSVCSDAEVPYVSYTQNLPIGDADSPRPGGRRLRPGRPGRSKQAPLLPKEIVVVKAAEAASAAGSDEDPDLRRLRLIPHFLPVMRGALTLPGSRDPDVLDRLDSAAVRQMAGRLQRHLATSAERTAARQAEVTAKVAQKVGEVSHAVQRCHLLLDDTVRQLRELNQQLPEEQRLQPLALASD
ncbi:BLOC-1-related complex subunit 5-like [Pollicipes pollicipes]|uniref:BLOC-1-related complex subunit 5-like n=1 Tax=Pollicipes pollicipes TaxID=41117 RepID=UPI001884B09B|nr:BLOC-1-related complex subunit 5-like [Pollicipes pollicipes]